MRDCAKTDNLEALRTFVENAAPGDIEKDNIIDSVFAETIGKKSRESKVRLQNVIRKNIYNNNHRFNSSNSIFNVNIFHDL